MGYWHSRGLRGSTLEEMINITNDMYREKGLALIQKISTPITPVELDSKNGLITKAYFEQKSTVDYIGAVQGIPLCFDAKETTRESLPIQNIHQHQILFMEDFEKQKGLAFLLVSFIKYKEFFYLPFPQLKECWDKSRLGGRKSIPYKDFDRSLIIKNERGFLLHYLEAVNTVLCRR